MSNTTPNETDMKSLLELETMDDHKAFASIVRQMISSEDNLTNQRLTWMATLNGLMLTASGLVWGKPDDRLIIYMICSVGLIINVSVFFSLYISEKARSRLLHMWAEKAAYIFATDKSRIIPPIIGYAGSTTFVRICLPWNLLPGAFIVLWVFLFAIKLFG